MDCFQSPLCPARPNQVCSDSHINLRLVTHQSEATNNLRLSLCDFPLHLPLELLGVDLTLQVDNPCDGETLKDEIDAAGTVCNISSL